MELSRPSTPGVSPTAELSHLFIIVGDLPTSRSFYADLIGLEVLFEEDAYVRLGGGEGFHMGMEQAPSGTLLGGQSIEIVIRVDDVDRRYGELRGKGVEFEAAPMDQPWGSRHAWLSDPDGNRISIFS